MLRRLALVALLVLCCLPGRAQQDPASAKAVPQNLAELESRIQEILDRRKVPAASVALVNSDEVVWAAGIGLADLESGRPATAETLFRVGSITKSFTALAVLRFVEDGRLQLENRLRDLIPEVEFENPWAESDPILLVHALEHTTGFDDLHLAEYAHNQGDPPVTLNEGLAYHPDSRVSRWRPGRHMAYCNSGPGMAAAALERLSGQTFEAIVTDRVLRPLGMRTATLLQPDGALLATGYEGDGETPGYYWHITTRPSGALNASAREMAGLLRMLLNRGAVEGVQVWQPASIDRMERPTTTVAARAGLTTGYGLANYVVQHEGFVWHGHNGGMNTFVADYGYNKEHGVGFFVAINVANGGALREIRDLLRAYLTQGLESRPEPPVEISPAELAEVTGYFRDIAPRQEIGRFLTRYFYSSVIRERDGKLTIGAVLGGGRPLIPLGDRRFRMEWESQASRIYVPDTEDGDLLLGNGSYRRISVPIFWVRLIGTAVCIVLLLTPLLFALIWVPRLAYRRLRGLEPPFSRPSLGRRVQPLAATVVLVLCIATLALGLADPIGRLAVPALESVGLAVGSLLYAALALASAAQWWRTRGERDVRQGVRIHSLLVNLAHVLTVLAMTSWGLLGLRTWL